MYETNDLKEAQIHISIRVLRDSKNGCSLILLLPSIKTGPRSLYNSRVVEFFIHLTRPDSWRPFCCTSTRHKPSGKIKVQHQNTKLRLLILVLAHLELSKSEKVDHTHGRYSPTHPNIRRHGNITRKHLVKQDSWGCPICPTEVCLAISHLLSKFKHKAARVWRLPLGLSRDIATDIAAEDRRCAVQCAILHDNGGSQ